MPVTGPSSPLTLTGLTNGQQYRARVRARNAAGWGPYSEWSAPFTPTAGGYADEVLADSPLLYWRLGEASGSTAADASGNSRTGTYNGTTLGVAGALAGDTDTAVSHDGVDDATTSSYNPFSGSLTFEGWGYRVAAGDLFPLFDSTGSDGVRLHSYANTTDVNFATRVGSVGNAATWTSALPAAGSWFHWVLTFDESTLTAVLWIDGVSQGSKSISTSWLTASAGNFRLGQITNIAAGKGRADEVAIYSGILSSTRIAAHYGAGT